MARNAATHVAVVTETSLGPCAMAWSDAGVTAFALPVGDATRTLAALRTRAPSAAPTVEDDLPAPAREILDAVRDLLATGTADLSWVPVVMPGGDGLMRRALTHIRTIPAGSTATYGDVAAAIGQPGAAQAVGRAMGANPVPVIVPCHRVVGADGRLVGFSADGGLEAKRRLLEVEGAAVVAQRRLF